MNRGIAAILVASSLPLALAYAADKKADIPQLESSAVGWSKVADDFQPPASGPGPVTYEKDHPYIPNNDDGRQVTFRIADLTNPILKPWAIGKMQEQNGLAAAGKRAYEARASCRPGGVPGFLVMGRVNPLYFVQGDNEVLLINEGGPEVRRVFLNVPHSANPEISPYGESVGHYEAAIRWSWTRSVFRTTPTSTIIARRTRRSFTSSSASRSPKAGRHCKLLSASKTRARSTCRGPRGRPITAHARERWKKPSAPKTTSRLTHRSPKFQKRISRTFEPSSRPDRSGQHVSMEGAQGADSAGGALDTARFCLGGARHEGGQAKPCEPRRCQPCTSSLNTLQ